MNNRLAEFTASLPDNSTLLIPGTGVKQGMDLVVSKGDRVDFDECEIDAFDGEVAGHERSVVSGEIEHKGQKHPVVVLGRVHPNENYGNPGLARVTDEIITTLRPKIANAIITNGVGGLSGQVGEQGALRDLFARRTDSSGRVRAAAEVGREMLKAPGRASLLKQFGSIVRQAALDTAGIAIKGRGLRETTPGDIVVIESIFLSLLNSLSPLKAGDFIDPQASGYSRDQNAYVQVAIDAVREVQGYCEGAGIYAFTPGPHFETPVEKILFRLIADVVGMSAAHEVLIMTKLKIPFAHIVLVTNGPFVVHSHEGNTDVGKNNAEKCAGVLAELVHRMNTMKTKE